MTEGWIAAHRFVVHSLLMPTPARQGRQTREQQAMVEQGRKHPGVAEALRLFDLAARRAPQVIQPQPLVRFSTSTNA